MKEKSSSPSSTKVYFLRGTGIPSPLWKKTINKISLSVARMLGAKPLPTRQPTRACLCFKLWPPKKTITPLLCQVSIQCIVLLFLLHSSFLFLFLHSLRQAEPRRWRRAGRWVSGGAVTGPQCFSSSWRTLSLQPVCPQLPPTATVPRRPLPPLHRLDGLQQGQVARLSQKADGQPGQDRGGPKAHGWQDSTELPQHGNQGRRQAPESGID